MVAISGAYVTFNGNSNVMKDNKAPSDEYGRGKGKSIACDNALQSLFSVSCHWPVYERYTSLASDCIKFKDFFHQTFFELDFDGNGIFCAEGTWLDSNFVTTADRWDSETPCTTCTVVSGALSSAAYTCTSASDSRVSACAASSTTKKTIGGTGATDTCTTTCAAGTSDQSNVCIVDYSTAICATPSDYDANHEYETNVGKLTCDQMAFMSGLTTSKQCTDVIPEGKAYTLKQTTNMMATIYGCCGSTKKSACWEDISAAVCATPSDYDANHEYEASNGQKTKCSAVATSLGLTATKQCTGDMKVKTNQFAAVYGCCGASKKSACWEDISASGKLELSFCNYK